MKRIVLIAAFAALSLSSVAQRKEAKLPDYQFTTVKSNPITSVKDQHRSGTCWAFSTIGYIESEVIRINGITDTLAYPDFSEFFVVNNSYKERAEKYVRLDGALGFSAGSVTGDVFHVIKDHGIVPQSAMSGMNYGTELPVQSEMDAVLKAYVNVIVSRPNKNLTTAWKRGFDAVVDEYLGKCPEKFTVNGKEYTPASYRDAMKFNPDDYVTLTSFTHHPFYSSFIIEIPDNWRWDSVYNIPIDELMSVVDNAVNDGYTIAWAADVSQFGFTRNGMAVLLDKSAKVTTGSDQEHWVGKEEGAPAPEIQVVEADPTQESRQLQFNDKTLTDDHGLQIYGIAKDQNGKKYYMTKNSWGTDNKFKGTWYATEAFLKGQTISITVHKSALSKELRKKIGK